MYYNKSLKLLKPITWAPIKRSFGILSATNPWFRLARLFRYVTLTLDKDFLGTVEIQITPKNIRKFTNTVRKVYREQFRFYLQDFPQREIIRKIHLYLYYKLQGIDPKEMALDKTFVEKMEDVLWIISKMFVELYPEEAPSTVYEGDLNNEFELNEGLRRFKLDYLADVLERVLKCFDKQDAAFDTYYVKFDKHIVFSPEIFDKEASRIATMFNGFFVTISQIKEVAKGVLREEPRYYLAELLQHQKDYSKSFIRLIKDVIKEK